MIGVLIPAVMLLMAVTGCSSSASHGSGSGNSGEYVPEDGRYSGMIQVDVGNGETRWVRDYEDAPVSSLKADQFEIGERFIRYVGEDYTVLQGIDVSTFQGDIDWKAVAGDGIEFAMLRLGGRGYGSGEIYEDDSFLSNLQGATDNGIRAGAYFFSQAVSPEEAEEEAEYVVGILQDLPAGSVTMPIAFDWEMVGQDGSRTDGMDEETLTACAAAFCRRISEAGYEPMVYAYRYLAYDMYDLSELAPYPLWISTLDGSPDFYYAFDMWQYTENGIVNGIQARVDMNLYFVPARPADMGNG